jgi:hypothetical protein
VTRDYPESYAPLCRRLGFHQGIPWTRNWTAAADFLELLADAVLEQRPQAVLECGSGLTTLVLARCCELAGSGRVVSLENGESFAVDTRQALAAYGLAHRATVLHAPLRPVRIGAESWQWYDTSCLPDDAFSLLVVDGPPGFLQPLSRYPALPLLENHLGPDWRLYLDDAARQEERKVVARWLAEYPGLQHRFVDNERGCSLLWR